MHTVNSKEAMMRQLLDRLYMVAAVVSSICMVGLFLAVMVSILGRQFDLNVVGIDAYAGYLMAACGFMALGYTLKSGGHIRVMLVLSPLTGRWRKVFEVFALVVATGLAILFCYYSMKLTYESYLYHDISINNDATPLWVPQLGMVIGSLVFAIAFIDELVLEFLGKRPREVESDLPLGG